MKKISFKIILALILGSFISMYNLRFAYASPYWHQHCFGPIQESTLVSSTSRFTSQCEAAQPLKLTRVNHHFPAMNEDLTVDAWKGSFTRSTETENVYRIDIYNCRGDLQRSDTSTEIKNGIATFPIDNPNLHDDVDLSFVASAPMTDGEAQSALTQARLNCQNGSNPQ